MEFLMIMLFFVKTEENILDKVKERYESIQTMQGNFIQRVCEKETGVCKEMKGKFYMRPPALFRIEFTSPWKQTIIGNNDTVWIYFIEEKKVIKTKASPGLTPLSIIGFIKNYKDIFDYEIKKEKNRYKAILIPKEDVAFVFTKLVLKIIPKRYIVESIKGWDSSLNEYDFIFNNVKVDKKIDGSLFRFTPSSEIEVIDTSLK